MPSVGGNEAISWILVLFLAGLLGGVVVYTLVQFNASINNTYVSNFVKGIMDVFNIIPTWLNILVIVGFASALALVGLYIYKVFEGRTKGM